MQNFKAVVAANFKWFITMMAMAIGSYYALSAKVEVNENEIKLNRVKIERNTDVIDKMTNEIEKLTITRYDNLELSKEIKFNLKRLMEAQGLRYISDENRLREK